MSSIADRVKSLVVDQYGADPERVTLATSIVDDLGGDSLDVVELVMRVEEEFDLEVPDDALDHLHTVGDVVSWLVKAGAR